MRKKFFPLIFVSICFLSVGLYSSVFAADAALIEAAKKEGKFVWYTSMPTNPAIKFLDAFKKKYPFLDTSQFFRSGSLKVYSRINLETAANKHLFDVSHVAVLTAYDEWKKKGWLLKYDSPVFDGYPNEIKDPGYWAPFRTFALIMAYNTELLPPNEVPKKWSDLVDPKWKGQLGVEGIDSGSQYLQYYTLKKLYGDEYWDKIAKNKPLEFGGTGAIMNGLLRGEIKLAMLQYCFGAYRYRELEKAPIQGIWPEEGVPISVAPMAINKNAPHPNAAKLFYDFALSKEGQMMMVELVGAYSGRPDVPAAKGNPSKDSFKKFYVTDIEEFSSGLQSYKESWKKVLQ
jgi:iron(III) transport system substrate-binding protein